MKVSAFQGFETVQSILHTVFFANMDNGVSFVDIADIQAYCCSKWRR
jgi:hypothetical protein